MVFLGEQDYGFCPTFVPLHLLMTALVGEMLLDHVFQVEFSSWKGLGRRPCRIISDDYMNVRFENLKAEYESKSATLATDSDAYNRRLGVYNAEIEAGRQ